MCTVIGRILLWFLRFDIEKKVLIIHYEFYGNYLNKNIGYFIDSAIRKGYQVDFLTLGSKIYDKVSKNNFNLIEIDEDNIESLKLYKYLFDNRKTYKYIWLYPSYKYFIFLLLFLKMIGIKSIIKTDSIEIKTNRKYSIEWWKQVIKKQLIVLMANKIIVENDLLMQHFKSKKTYLYGLGLPQSNLDIIKKLSNWPYA